MSLVLPRVVFAAAAVLALLAAGCVLPDQMAQVQKEMADVQQEALSRDREHEELRQRVAGMEAQVGSQDPVKRTEFADLKLRLDGLSRQNAAVEDSLAQIRQQIDRLSQEIQAVREIAKKTASSPVSSASMEAAAAGVAALAVPNPLALFNAAYADFSKGNYDLAVSGFEEYAQRFPEDPQADNALYWVAECAFSQGRFQEAIEAYDRLLEQYPRSDRAAAADLKKGLAYLEKGQVPQAVEQLRHVTATYPGTDEASVARDRLASLGKGGR